MDGKRKRDDIEDEEEAFTSKVYLVNEEDDLDDSDKIQNETYFICGIDGCEEEFTSEKDYEDHYEAFHHFVCSICKKCLLSDYLLSLHVLENHDNLFKLMNQQQPMYQCYVRSCKEKFNTSEERDNHAIIDHHFPISSRIFDNKEELSDSTDMETEDNVTLNFIFLLLEYLNSSIM